MKFFKVLVEEFSGYDCDGHFDPYIVVADTPMDAVTTVIDEIYEDFDISRFNIEIDPENGYVNIDPINDEDNPNDDVYVPEDSIWSVNEFNIPDLNKVEKPFIIF